MPLKIVACQRWGKDNPLFVQRCHRPSCYIFFFNSNTRPCFDGYQCISQAKYIQNLHTKKAKNNTPDVRYNFLIGGDGVVYEGRGWMVQAPLPRRYHPIREYSLSIAFIGTFVETSPTLNMYDAREELIIYGVKNGYIVAQHLQFSLPTLDPRESYE